MVNDSRLKEEFVKLVTLDGPSLQEREVGEYVAERLQSLGAKTRFDKAGEKIGGNCGNLMAVLPATAPERPPLMFNAHLDIIKSPSGGAPLFINGVFRSRRGGILGADDRAGIAAILELLQVLQEDNLRHGQLEMVFTVAEEIGMLGAKHINYNTISATTGFALDGGDPQQVIVAAPASNRMQYRLYGLAAHAGVHPEEGINAITIAARAISDMSLGRIDSETTANIGTIQGGTATNIIPDYVEVHGEARSHDMAKLEGQTALMGDAFRRALSEFTRPGGGPPRLEEKIRMEYPLMKVPEESRARSLVVEAGSALGREFEFVPGGGGSDANIFNNKGIETVILGTGMHNPHTDQEHLALADLAACADLLVRLAATN